MNFKLTSSRPATTLAATLTTAITVTLGALITVASAPVAAATVSYNFSTTIDTSTSPLNGQAFSGSFSFDNSNGLPGLGSETLYTLTSFSFNFPGGPFGLPSLSYGDAVFEGAGFKGLDAGAAVFSFLPASGSSAAFFAFDTGRDRGNGSLSFSPVPTQVPAPASLPLALLALALMALMRTQTVRRAHC